MTRILRIDDATLAAFAVRAGAGRDSRQALGAELDAEADVLLLGDLDGVSPDRTAAASALLAITRRVVVVPIIGARQHPVNLARTIATLSNLHARRVGLAGTEAAEGGVYVDDARILRIVDPAFPHIGGPLTLPVDTTDKPVTVLLGGESTAPGVDVVLDAASVPAWGADAGAPGGSPGARAVFGLAASEVIATGAPAFAGAGRLDQV